MNGQKVLRGTTIRTVQILVWPIFVSAGSQFVSHADAAAVVEKGWRLNYVHQNNVERNSVRQNQLYDFRNQLFRLRYSFPAQLIRAVHYVLEYTQQRRDNGAEKCYPLESDKYKIVFCL